MDFDVFKAFAPPCKTPKSLGKQVANALAVLIIKKTLPALIQYWGTDYKLPHGDSRSESSRSNSDGDRERGDLESSSSLSSLCSEDSDDESLRKDLVVHEAIEQFEPPMNEEEVTLMEPMTYKSVKVIEKVSVSSNSNRIRELDVDESAAIAENQLSKQIDCVMEMARRGIESLMLVDESDSPSDSEGFDDDDLELMQLHPGHVTEEEETSGSGGISPESEDVSLQDPLQNEYLNEDENKWVKDLTNKMLLSHLQKVKRWYDKVITVQARSSLMHYMVGEAIIEILDSFISPRICEPFHRYNLQVMFCQNVGFLGQDNMEEIHSKSICRLYANFLSRLRPFSMRSLYTIPMAFADPAPLKVLMKNSKHLRKISISVMHCRKLFSWLELYNSGVVEISAFAGGPFGDSGLTENFLFKTFFRDLTKTEVIFSIIQKKSVGISFPSLQRLNLHFISEVHHHFIHSFQHLYPNVKTNFLKVITERIMSPTSLKAKLSPPYFLEGKGVFSWDSVYLMSGHCQFIENPFDEVRKEPYPRIRSLSVWQNKNDISPKLALIRELITRYGCSSLVLRMPFMYLDNDVDIISPCISSIGDYLTELHVLASKSVFHVSELVAGLKSCKRLKLMSIDVASFWPITESETLELEPMMDLKSLSITANILIDQEFDLRREARRLSDFLGDVLANAPNLLNLEMIRTPIDVVIDTTKTVRGKSKITTLVLDTSLFWNLDAGLTEAVENLSSLSYLLLYGITPQIYAQVKKYFYRTNLQIAYRAQKMLGAGEPPIN
ncbi:uncharacterized protein [Palaemon carinicauda]|uniref:uncharacterized protein n=1 Tax=Palaemon carinicauda TaxID=392227 RepID=UPI0035B5B5BA